MKNFCCLFFWKRSISINSLKKLAIFAVLHENIDFAIGFDHLVHLYDVFMEDVSLYVYFLLKGSKLLVIVA